MQEESIQRNIGRTAQVSKETIRKVAGELESPLVSGSRYDRATLQYCEGTSIKVTHCLHA